MIKFSVFKPPQSNFCISNATFCLPSQILITFGIHTKTLGKKALIYSYAPCCLSTLFICCRPQLFYIIERVKQNKMQLYLTIKYILCWSPPGKWVLLGQTVEGRSKYSDLFVGILWHLLQTLMINAAIVDSITLYKCVPTGPDTAPAPCPPNIPADPAVPFIIIVFIVITFITKITTSYPWMIKYCHHSLGPYLPNSVRLTPTHVRVWWIRASSRVVRDSLLLELILQRHKGCGGLRLVFIFRIRC